MAHSIQAAQAKAGRGGFTEGRVRNGLFYILSDLSSLHLDGAIYYGFMALFHDLGRNHVLITSASSRHRFSVDLIRSCIAQRTLNDSIYVIAQDR